MSALICVDSLKVADVSNNVILIDDPIAPEHVPSIPSDLKRLAAVVPLDHGHHLWSESSLLVLQA